MGEVIESKDAGRGGTKYLLQTLDLEQVLDRDVEHLSGGELQRFAIAVVAAQEADVYMVDEPSSYLDVRQRLKAAQVRYFVFLFDFHPIFFLLRNFPAFLLSFAPFLPRSDDRDASLLIAITSS